MRYSLTIGFDVTSLSFGNMMGGVFQYAFRLISAVVRHTGIRVVVIIGPWGKNIFEPLKLYDNFKEVVLEPTGSFREIVISEKIDIVHAPIQLFTNITFSVPMISTLHDLQQFHYPEFFSKEEIEMRNFYYKVSAEFAETVIVSYQHVKDDIVKFYGIPADKISVCPLGTEAPLLVDQAKFPEVKQKYGLPDEYLFYSANTWRHKNHINLIKALKILHEKHGIKIPLICTGYTYQDYYPQIKVVVEELNLQDSVKFTEYIPEEEMFLLLKNATLAVVPTLYEAGSFPLMEAMIHYVPAICSNVTSLPETIGDQRFVFDPKNIEQIAEKTATMLKDENLREENRRNSFIRVREWGWDRRLIGFVDVYKKAIERFKERNDAQYLKMQMQRYELFTITTDIKRETTLAEKDRQLAEKDRQLAEKDRQLAEKDRQLAKQQNQIEELMNSYSWRITAPIRRIYEKLNKVEAANIQKQDKWEAEMDDMDKAWSHLAEKGFQPNVVLDVGAAKGWWSVRAKEYFKESEFFMIDPLQESEANLSSICRNNPKFHYLLTAIGSENGSFTINVFPDFDGSTLLHFPGENVDRQRKIPIATLDQLLFEKKIKPPDFVKIDVQGYELKVLQGGQKVFDSAEVFIIEVNLFKFMTDCPLIHEVIAYMAERKFFLFDLAGALRRPFENDLGQLDLVFVSAKSPMVENNRWM